MKKDSITVRIVIIIGIIVVLVIPLLMIQSLINERQEYRNKAENEIYKSWAGKQIAAGPILTVEKEFVNVNKEGDKIINRTFTNYLPEQLNIECELIPEIRYRGIYEVVIYKTHLKITGNFPKFENDNESENIPRTVTQYVSFNISDLRGIEENVKLKMNDNDLTVIPGLRNQRIFKNGFVSYLDFKDDTELNFTAEITLRGSNSIEFVPLGKMTKVEVKSNWNNPSFTGAFLPNSRNVNESGFTASWKINHFNREFPQVWNNQSYQVFQSTFGVKLLMPVDEYQKTMRTSKYGIMIIILTFVSFFLIEIFSKKVIHPVQYLLVGLSLVIFYSLLLSISEYIVFKYSYILSSVLVILLIGLYIKSIYSSMKISLIITSILILFYGFMFVILQLQELALLFGNIALFVVLAVIMYLTRKLNWFELFTKKEDSQKQIDE